MSPGASYLEKLRHGPSLLFSYGCILLLYHSQSANGELELHLDLGLETELLRENIVQEEDETYHH